MTRPGVTIIKKDIKRAPDVNYLFLQKQSIQSWFSTLETLRWLYSYDSNNNRLHFLSPVRLIFICNVFGSMQTQSSPLWFSYKDFTWDCQWRLKGIRSSRLLRVIIIIILIMFSVALLLLLLAAGSESLSARVNTYYIAV